MYLEEEWENVICAWLLSEELTGMSARCPDWGGVNSITGEQIRSCLKASGEPGLIQSLTLLRPKQEAVFCQNLLQR